MTKSQKTELLIVGKLGSSYGVKGWLRINSFTQNKEDIFNYKNWFIQKNGQFIETKVTDWKKQGDSLLAKLENLNSLEEAKLYVNCQIYIKTSDLPELEDEYYWIDLIGCTVYNKDNYKLGKVKQILETGSNDVLVLKAPIDDKYDLKERLIPFIPDQFILNVDVNKKEIFVDWDPEF